MKKIFIAVLFLITAVMTGCGKTKEGTQEQDGSVLEENVRSEEITEKADSGKMALWKQDEKSCLFLEDEDCIYVCGTYRLLKVDKATGEAVSLWENEGAAKKQEAYLYSEGQGLLLEDRIYFIEAWMEEDMVTEHKALSVINTDGTDYCRIEEIPGYSDDSMALVDGILYVDAYNLPQNGTGSMLSYVVLKDGTLAENIEAADMEGYAGIPEGYMHSSYHSSGQRTLFTAEALKNFGYMILENEDYELVKVMPDTGEEISLSSEFGILYSYNDNYFLTSHYGADKSFYLYDRETMEGKLLFGIEGGAETIDMDQDYVYIQYSQIDGKDMEAGASKNIFEKISLRTGERTVIFEKDVQKGMEYDLPQLLSDMVVKNGYLYYVGEENYKLYLMRRSLNMPETEEKLGDAFYDTGIGEVGTIVSYYEEFYSEAVPDTMLAYVELEWLKVDERFDGAEEINRYLTEYQNQNIEYEKSNSGWLEEILEEDGTGTFGLPYSYSGSLSEIAYFDEVYLSFCQQEYDYMGGAHGMPCRTGFTFDLETGQRLFLKDVIKNSEEELKDIVTEYFAEYIGKNPEDFWEGSVDYVREYTDFESPFYLTEEGIVFYFGPYELAPYVGGFQKVVIPYEEFEMKIQVNPPYLDYYRKYQEMTERYGEPELYSLSENYGLGVCYLQGVCVVDLMDYNGDGILDLLLIYADGKPAGMNMHDHSIPLADDYKLEIWTKKNDVMSQLLMLEHVSSFKTFQTEYWDSDDCFLTVFENKDGMPVIQIYEEQAGKSSYTNYYCKNGEAVKDIYTYEQEEYKRNQMVIPEEEFIEGTAGYDTVLLGAYLSDNQISPDYLWEYHIDIDSVLEQTKCVVSTLQSNKPCFFEITQAHYIPIYEKVLMSMRNECIDRQLAGYTDSDFNYALYDMDQNGIPELIVKSGSCEADYQYEIYTIDDGKAVLCGKCSGFHSTLSVNGKRGIVRYAGQMGVYEIMYYSLNGTKLVEKEIAGGSITMEEEYPELKKFGYGEYDILLGLGRGGVSYALYEKR